MNESLYQHIFKRKSNRKYKMTPLKSELLGEILSFAENIKPLYDSIKVEYTLTDNVRNVVPVKAPHYFIIASEKKEGYLINVGFMFQQMDLFLSSKGLGSCWLGMARPSEKIATKLEFVIIFAFGETEDSPYRELSDFKRKDLSEISEGNDERLECARLAPSASNTQNWYYVCNNDKVHVYRKKLNPVQAMLYEKVNQIDMGIGICHLYVATLYQGKTFSFIKDASPKELKGYSYIGAVE